MSTDAARVYDLRYRRDDGERASRLRAWLSFVRWSVRRALGVGRDWRAKLPVIALTLAAFGPAVAVLGVRALIADRVNQDLPTQIISYRSYAGLIGLTLLVFTAIITPRLVCEDRADRVLGLYFATAVGRVEYVTAKLAAAALPILALTTLPVLLLFLGNVVFAVAPLDEFTRNWLDIPRIAGAGLLMTLFYAALGVAIASLTGRAALAVGGYAALMIGSGVAAAAVGSAIGDERNAGAFALVTVPVRMYESLFPATDLLDQRGPPVALSATVWAVTIAVSGLMLSLRYRSTRG